MSGSSAEERISSIERVLMTVARGRLESSRLRSATSVSMPWRPSAMAVVSPAGPAPAISTCVVRCASYAISKSSIGQWIFYRTECLTMDNMSSEY
jgi:hypothetical protein